VPLQTPAQPCPADDDGADAGAAGCSAAAVAAAWVAHLAAAAGLWPGTDKDALVVILGINDLHIHHAGAQAKELKVIPDQLHQRHGSSSSSGSRWV